MTISVNPVAQFMGGFTSVSGTPSLGGGIGNQNIAQLLTGLAQALQALAQLLGGQNGQQAPGGNGGGSAIPTAANAAGAPSGGGAASAASKPIAGSARIWGDPHFIGADGDKFDVQGEAGKTYNLLSDRGFQMNGRFDKYGDNGATVVGEVGISAGANYVSVDKTGKAIVNGQELKDGQRIELRDGGFAEKRGNTVTVKKGEWDVSIQSNGQYLDMDIKTDNAVADGVKPQGLIGQTFDGDGKALTGDAGAGAQGGGAIKDANGNLTKAGDKNAVKSYEVNALWDTSFRYHNADHAQQSAYNDQARDSVMAAFGLLASSLTMMGFGASGFGSSGFGGNEWAKAYA